jgi:hypothetical protein
MTTGVVNNWDTLNVTGTITPDAIDSPTILVNGTAVQPAIAQLAYIADATDGTDVITQLNALLAALQADGLMAGPPEE